MEYNKETLSAFWSIITHKILLIQARSNQNISALELFVHELRLSSFADYANCMTSKIKLAKELSGLLTEFAQF